MKSRTDSTANPPCKLASPVLPGFFLCLKTKRPTAWGQTAGLGRGKPKHPLLKVEIGSKASIVTKVIMLQEKQ
ncbi:hypothetical protein TH30_19330 [Thalassospira profundimaris]|uniref:Uncharacterized protein n=1 Tax=Thalassospira profundimaris TaxID=502049 RepID=A0A367WNX3_9PROT|nr:hypothetical protein TH30_19330 [Thalassospira profundimaris]